MTFEEAQSYLFSLGNEVSAMKLGLTNIRTLLDALGKPHEQYLKVQVAGTNGKGSVCAFLDSICREAGVKTGLYISPHLISITERVKIGGVDISECDFARIATIVRETAEKLLADGELEYRPTFFEQMTAIALVAFAEAKVDLAILETGLGGRLDATTAANAEIVAITRIDLDHQEYLGETIEEIAAEKAAIINKETREVVIGEQASEVMAILRNRCREFGLEPLNDEYEPWTVLPNDGELVKVDLSLLVHEPIRLGLKGRHQIENAQTAVQTAKALHYHGAFLDLQDGEGTNEIRMLEGLRKASHPGRLEYEGQYLFDGAHNIGGAKALAVFLTEFEKRPITLVFGAMRDKEIAEIVSTLFPLAAKIVLTEPENSRSLTYSDLLEQIPDEISRSNIFATDRVENALAIAEAVSAEDGIILVTGSLYLVGDVKRILRSQI